MRGIIFFSCVVISALVAICLSSTAADAATLTDDFNAGLASTRWQIGLEEASGSPWTVQAPDALGRIRWSKSTDSDTSTNLTNISASLWSQFRLVGNASTSVKFSFLTFPNAQLGWNEVGLIVRSESAYFEVLRANSVLEGYYTNAGDGFGWTSDSSTSEILGVTRTGSTMSAWYDRGNGPVVLGSVTSSSFLGPLQVELIIVQAVNYPLGRPHTALDVAIDNFTATADSIVPEPASLSLLALGGVALIRRRHRVER